MKILKFIALAAVLITSQAKADCQEYVLKRFEEIRTEAIRVNVPEFSQPLKEITAKFIGGKNTFYGHYVVQTNKIEFDKEVCDLPVELQNRVISHEIGHAVAMLKYPATKKEFLADIKLFESDVHERLADQEGTKILDNALNHQIVDIAEKKCTETKAVYFCEVSVNWLYAITH